jgi:hypothetical protein
MRVAPEEVTVVSIAEHVIASAAAVRRLHERCE